MQDSNYRTTYFSRRLNFMPTSSNVSYRSTYFIPKSYIEQLKEDGLYEYFVDDDSLFLI